MVDDDSTHLKNNILIIFTVIDTPAFVIFHSYFVVDPLVNHRSVSNIYHLF